MDPSYIIPFITSVQNVFSTMLNTPVETGDPTLKSDAAPSCDISGIIGMSGDVQGSVVLSFPQATAQRVVALFAGSEMDPASSDFTDAVGELVNMVCGGAKAMFGGTKKVSISCPNVVMGPNHKIARLKDVPTIMIPCATDCGNFVIEVAVQEAPGAQAAAA